MIVGLLAEDSRQKRSHSSSLFVVTRFETAARSASDRYRHAGLPPPRSQQICCTSKSVLSV